MSRLRQWGFGQQLALIALAGFAFRIAYVLIFRWDHIPFLGDSVQYSNGANALAAGKGFINAWAALGQRNQPSASHPPLYMVWLAIPSWFTHDHATQLVHMLWTCVLDIGTIVVVGLTGRKIAGPRAGLIAALLAAFYPNIWVHDGVLLSESMAIFTVALVVWAAYAFYERPSFASSALLGAFCGLAALSRSELLILAPLLILPVLFRRREAVGPRLMWIAAGALAAAIVVSPWIIYNNGRFKDRVRFTTNFGVTLAAANCQPTYYGNAIGFKNYGCALAAAQRATRPGQDESQTDKELSNQAKLYMKAHKARVPVVVLARWGRALEIFRPADDVHGDEYFGRREPFVSTVAVYSWDFMLALAIAGAFVMRARRVSLLPLLAPACVVFVSIGLTFAQTRYRAPAEVPVVLLATVAIDTIINRLRPRATSPLAVSNDTPPAQRDTAAIASST